MRPTLRQIVVFVAVSLCCAAPLLHARPAVGVTSIQSATDRAVELQKSIDQNRDTLSALDERVEAMESRLFRKKTELSDARARTRIAYSNYRDRLVSLYKSGNLGPVEVLVEATSLRDLYYRTNLISRLADNDRKELVEARMAHNDAEYAALVITQMRTELVEMKAERTKKLSGLRSDLATQRALLRRLNQASRDRVSRVADESRVSRSEWERTSLPRGAKVGLAKATVSPYPHTYLVTTHQPRRYRSAGGKFTAVCSWYGNEFHGRRTASGQIFNENDFTCASKTLPFGTRLALSRSSKRIVVVVTDRGPFVRGRDLDLSKAAARALGIGGVGAVTAERVTVVR